MINWTTYTSGNLFYTLCSCWNRFVRDEFKIDDIERDIIKCPITLDLIISLLNECFERDDLTEEQGNTVVWMGSTITLSKDWIKRGK